MDLLGIANQKRLSNSKVVLRVSRTDLGSPRRASIGKFLMAAENEHFEANLYHFSSLTWSFLSLPVFLPPFRFEKSLSALRKQKWLQLSTQVVKHWATGHEVMSSYLLKPGFKPFAYLPYSSSWLQISTLRLNWRYRLEVIRGTHWCRTVLTRLLPWTYFIILYLNNLYTSIGIDRLTYEASISSRR